MAERRQCCAHYADTKSALPKWQRAKIRCKNTASITIFGGKPINDDELLPAIAFLCRVHQDARERFNHTVITWHEVKNPDEVFALLDRNEAEDYINILRDHVDECASNRDAWEESRKVTLRQVADFDIRFASKYKNSP